MIRRDANTRVIVTVKKIEIPQKIVEGKMDMDSHADTTVAGANCCILLYTGKECDVAPYQDDYDSIPNIPIVTAETAWKSDYTGQVYIIVLNEALWMGNDMSDTLVNPIQTK